jgi:hypothetical protein
MVTLQARTVHSRARTDTPARSLDGTETTAIAIAPNEALCVRRHQLAMRIGNLALRCDGQKSVVQGPVPRTRFDALTDADANRNLQIAGGFAEAGDFGTRYYDAVLPESGEHLLCPKIVPSRPTCEHTSSPAEELYFVSVRTRARPAASRRSQ